MEQELLKKTANDYAERVCNGTFPIEYTREQVVKHTSNDFIAGVEFILKNKITHLKLDRSTLPNDGQRISFQTQNEEWHEGYFVSGDDLFWINESKWYPAFDIVSWKPND